jgi:zinc finger MYND domain-containing protein 10
MDTFEARCLIDGLSRSLKTSNLKESVESINSDCWLKLHFDIEKLNRLVHNQAINNEDEEITRVLCESDLIPVLVERLLVIRFWKDKVLPLLIDDCSTSFTKGYLPIYHELVIVNLLEVLFFHREAVESGEERFSELIEYLFNRIGFLFEYKNCKKIRESVERTLVDSNDETNFNIGICCITLFRYLTEYTTSRPSLNLMVSTYDFYMILVNLLEKSPWKRKHEVFQDGKWQPDEQTCQGYLPKCEVQILLSLFFMFDDKFLSLYDLSSSSVKTNNALKIRRFLTEEVIDQIPVLEKLHRFLEEIALCPKEYKSSMTNFLIEPVSEISEALKVLEDKENLAAIIEKQKLVFAQDQSETASILFKFYEDVLHEEDPVCPVCSKVADQRCSVCKKTFYCSRECQLKHWVKHKLFCVAI